ncbi:HD domain-containing protein [Desulfofustis limnaeus]|jgi:putative nucleotidyltransferase with HDIG domain|uniref:Phosphohydrolase n=1 Tax=Desulfofustis limnaeus TaxID=2740163 RepID=A0ABM7W6N3_9BACT|nr:HD domain-containing protein [Desulfofustis limnaeus]MDX9896173.1 HD domain-containing protein [Desulfofustis sp.]BDD86624.1 phosphohydrolase [Desulfofustis limnaeus]
METPRAIPDQAVCLELMEQYGMLDNIRRHSLLVARVAETLVGNLHIPADSRDFRPNRNLVLAGALLHDIAKTRCLDGSCRHAEEGQLICEEHGYPEVGVIVGEHVLLSSFTPEYYRRGRFPAREIVYYADKRVKHDQIVSLQERLLYIIDRYSGNLPAVEQRIRENFRRCQELERHLFSFLPFSAEELPHRLLPLAGPGAARIAGTGT